MNTEYDKQLERRIHAELTALPPLEAPSEIGARVMAVLAQQRPADVQPTLWAAPVWSMRARSLLFFALAVITAGVAYGLFQAWQSHPVSSLAQSSDSAMRFMALLGGLIHTLFSACGMALRKLGAPMVTALITAAILCYLTCVALGTVWYRVAFGHSTPTR